MVTIFSFDHMTGENRELSFKLILKLPNTGIAKSGWVVKEFILHMGLIPKVIPLMFLWRTEKRVKPQGLSTWAKLSIF